MNEHKFTLIKSIDTFWNGHRFRHPLEARWAVFYDALEIPYEYEKQGYELQDDGHGKALYLRPDFWLPDQKFWVDVQSEWYLPKSEVLRAEALIQSGRLARSSGIPVFIAIGEISDPMPERIDTPNHWPPLHLMVSGEVDEEQVSRGEEAYCCEPWWSWSSCVAHSDDIRRWVQAGCECQNDVADPFDRKILAAYQAARQMRFEQGNRQWHTFEDPNTGRTMAVQGEKELRKVMSSILSKVADF